MPLDDDRDWKLVSQVSETFLRKCGVSEERLKAFKTAFNELKMCLDDDCYFTCVFTRRKYRDEVDVMQQERLAYITTVRGFWSAVFGYKSRTYVDLD